MATAESNITLNQGSGGPVVATDFVNPSSGISAHVQYVKIDIGAENAHDPVTTSNALPTSISSLPSTWTTLPVGGGTNGQGITITGTIQASDVGISHGTLDRIAEGVSIDIRSFGGFTVPLGLAADGFGKIAEGVSVDIRGFEDGLTVGVTFGAGGLNIVDGVNGVTLSRISSSIEFAVKNVTSGELAVTMDSPKLNELPLGSTLSSGMVYVETVGITSSTLPAATATRFIEFSNIGTLGPDGATGVAGISSGAVVLIGLNGATAFGGGAGTTIGSMYLNTGGHGSTGFCGIMIPGDSLRFENRSLDEFRVTCIAGHGGQTQASVMYRTY
mgnify:CR=1 FL=1